VSECIKLDLIRTDAGTQVRVCLTDDVVADYAARMLEGDKFPPVAVFHDGTSYILADGFHRVMAALHNNFKDILADVRKGSKLDALKFALGANRANGLRRTNADKRRSVVIALQNFANQSDRAIADMCGVNHEMVGSLRSDQVADSATRIGRDGKSQAAKKKKLSPVEMPEENSGRFKVAASTTPPVVTHETSPGVPVVDEWGAEPEPDSPVLAELKTLWGKATQPERMAFSQWAHL